MRTGLVRLFVSYTDLRQVIATHLELEAFAVSTFSDVSALLEEPGGDLDALLFDAWDVRGLESAIAAKFPPVRSVALVSDLRLARLWLELGARFVFLMPAPPADLARAIERVIDGEVSGVWPRAVHDTARICRRIGDGSERGR